MFSTIKTGLTVGLLLALLVSGCSPKKTYYQHTQINNIKVCDLNIIDTFDLLRLNQINGDLSKSAIMSLYEVKQFEWKSTDINITRCSSKKHPDANKALRVYIPREKWTDGFHFRYDLYFDEQEKLIRIESRHRYIDIK